jgi:Trm5-related predicted tRNA methylase
VLALVACENARFALAKSQLDRRPNGIIDIMPTSRDLHPLTSEQAVQLRHDLTLVEERLQDIAILMRVCYGEDSQAVIRADETAAALQRLKWELERMQVRRQAAGSF